MLDKTMFTKWMEANKIYPEARHLTYADFPTQWVWHQKQKMWKLRERGRAIGRINFVHPAAGELYFLRLLLNVIKGATSFVDLKTVNGVAHPSFQSASRALGLLGDDREWDHALEQASLWATGHELRQLFVTLIIFCEVQNPMALWERHWMLFSEDIQYNYDRAFRNNHCSLTEEELKNKILISLEMLFNKNGSSLLYYDLPFPLISSIQAMQDRLIRE